MTEKNGSDYITLRVWTFVILLLAVGIFFRTYHFHDWLRFNADQSRDATVVSNVVEGKDALPLLGPKAGGTGFRLGPAFYYFQITAAKIFGNSPDKMAYPDLLFSILAIPLLFFFLRKYFDMRTALLLTALFAVSAYAVKYSRFAWNPNSLPFWTLLYLYALHEIVSMREATGRRWPIIAGVALGIGIQLHTLILILFPAIALTVFGYLLVEKKKVWKALVIVFLVALFLNGSQLVSEIQTGGANAKAFFSAIGTKEKKGNGTAVNIAKDVVCFVEGNDYILSSYDASDTCEWKSTVGSSRVLIFSVGCIFFIGGILLAVRSFRKETESGKKYFLGIFLLYCSLYFLLLVPLANEVSMRFFLGIIFMPFVFLGLWFKYLSEKFPIYGTYLALSITILFITTNIVSVQRTFSEYAAYLQSSSAGMDNVLLREVERSAAFVVAHAPGAQVVAVHGDAAYLFKALKSMQYFTSKSDIRLVQKKGDKNDLTMPVFLIDNTKGMTKILEKNSGITEYESFGRFTIFKEQ